MCRGRTRKTRKVKARDGLDVDDESKGDSEEE